MLSSDGYSLADLLPFTSVDLVIKESVERLLAAGPIHSLGIGIAAEQVVWESLLYHLGGNPLLGSEMVVLFPDSRRTRVSVPAVMFALRQSAVEISPACEARVAIAIAQFLAEAPGWILAELREMGVLVPS